MVKPAYSLPAPVKLSSKLRTAAPFNNARLELFAHSKPLSKLLMLTLHCAAGLRQTKAVRFARLFG